MALCGLKALLGVVVLSTVIALPVYAQSEVVNFDAATFSADDVVSALQGQVSDAMLTRGITRSKAENGRPGARKLSVQMQFGVNSAALSELARRRLEVLADGLAAPALSSLRFEISGHTDISGNLARNMSLSRQRAEAVTEFLVQQGGLDRSRLQASGRGPTELLDRRNASSPVNRRVQIEVLEPR